MLGRVKENLKLLLIPNLCDKEGEHTFKCGKAICQGAPLRQLVECYFLKDVFRATSVALGADRNASCPSKSLTVVIFELPPDACADKTILLHPCLVRCTYRINWLPR